MEDISCDLGVAAGYKDELGLHTLRENDVFEIVIGKILGLGFLVLQNQIALSSSLAAQSKHMVWAGSCLGTLTS
jgi:hypothetical protein